MPLDSKANLICPSTKTCSISYFICASWLTDGQDLLTLIGLSNVLGLESKVALKRFSL